MGVEQALGLLRAILQGEGGGHPEGVEGVDVAARGKDVRAADQVAAGDGAGEMTAQGAEDGGDFGLGLEFGVQSLCLGPGRADQASAARINCDCRAPIRSI